LAILSTCVATLATARSFLFAPGGDERKLTKALAAGADAVVADLEDATPAAEKDAARALVATLLAHRATESLRLVRVNGVGTRWFEDDLAAVSALRPDAVVLPKATPEGVAALAGVAPVVAIVETAAGLQRSDELARAGVAALQLGAVDLGLELGLEPVPGGEHLLFARSKLVLDSAAAGLRGPVDQVWVDTRDGAGLERDGRLARALGFRGKACIHPAQVEIVNRVFTPSEAELARAAALVEAYDEAVGRGAGAVALDGEMIDLPVVERARQLLAAAGRS
jgi:citrate lyase beta subunit